MDNNFDERAFWENQFKPDLFKPENGYQFDVEFDADSRMITLVPKKEESK